MERLHVGPRFASGPQAIWPTPPSGARSVGPYNFGNWNGESGSDNASNYVYGNLNSITYVETSYALLHHDPCAYVENASSAFVQPSRDADATALLSDQLEPDLEQLLTGVYLSTQPTAFYPISAYSYLLTGYNTLAARRKFRRTRHRSSANSSSSSPARVSSRRASSAIPPFLPTSCKQTSTR